MSSIHHSWLSLSPSWWSFCVLTCSLTAAVSSVRWLERGCNVCKSHHIRYVVIVIVNVIVLLCYVIVIVITIFVQLYQNVDMIKIMCLSCQAFFVSEFQLKASVFFSPLIKLPLVNQDHRKKRKLQKSLVDPTCILSTSSCRKSISLPSGLADLSE